MPQLTSAGSRIVNISLGEGTLLATGQIFLAKKAIGCKYLLADTLFCSVFIWEHSCIGYMNFYQAKQGVQENRASTHWGPPWPSLPWVFGSIIQSHSSSKQGSSPPLGVGPCLLLWLRQCILLLAAVFIRLTGLWASGESCVSAFHLTVGELSPSRCRSAKSILL